MKIIVNDQLINYEDQGSGRVIIFLHGWGVDMSTFDKLANHFVKNFRVIRFDFPGFGQSPRPTSDWSVSDYSELTANLLKKLKIPEVYAVIAHSFGGRVIIKGVSMDILKPKKLVFIGVAGVKPPQSTKKALYKVAAKIGKAVTSVPVINKLQPKLRKQLYVSAGSIDYLTAGEMKSIFLNTINEDLLPSVSKISQPTLLIWGQNDGETPINDAHLILDRLSNGQLTIIPDTGHFVYLEAYDQVSKKLDDFLS